MHNALEREGILETDTHKLFTEMQELCGANVRNMVLLSDMLRRRALWDLKRHYYSKILVGEKIPCEPGFVEQEAARLRKLPGTSIDIAALAEGIKDETSAQDFKDQLDEKQFDALLILVRSKNTRVAQ